MAQRQAINFDAVLPPVVEKPTQPGVAAQPRQPAPATPQPSQGRAPVNFDAVLPPAKTAELPRPGMAPPPLPEPPSFLGGLLSDVGSALRHPFTPLVKLPEHVTMTVPSGPSYAPHDVDNQSIPELQKAKAQGYEPTPGGTRFARKPTGAEQAFTETVEGLTSPASVGLTAATMGAGAVAPNLAKVALPALGLAFTGQALGHSGGSHEAAAIFEQEAATHMANYQRQVQMRNAGLLPPSIDPEHTKMLAEGARKKAEYYRTHSYISGAMAAAGVAGELANAPRLAEAVEGKFPSIGARRTATNEARGAAAAETLTSEAEAAAGGPRFTDPRQEQQAKFEQEPVSHASARDAKYTQYGRTRPSTPPGEPIYMNRGGSTGPGEPPVAQPAEPVVAQPEAHPQQTAVTHADTAATTAGRSVTRERISPDGTIEREFGPASSVQPATAANAPAQEQTPAVAPANTQDVPAQERQAPAAQPQLTGRTVQQPQQALPPSPRYVEPKPHQPLVDLANEYNASAGLPPVKHEPFEVDEANSREVAKFYESAQADVNNPEVQSAYKAFVDETHKQFEFLKLKGYTFTFTDNPSVYKTSADMNNDVQNNKHVYVFNGFNGPEGIIPNDVNLEFRGVHDILGHAAPGNTFGHGGEEGAYYAHSQMYSPEAQKAMATETRGQNATNHFGSMGNPEEGIYQDRTDAIKNFTPGKYMLMPEGLRSPTPKPTTQAPTTARKPVDFDAVLPSPKSMRGNEPGDRLSRPSYVKPSVQGDLNVELRHGDMLGLSDINEAYDAILSHEDWKEAFNVDPDSKLAQLGDTLRAMALSDSKPAPLPPLEIGGVRKDQPEPTLIRQFNRQGQELPPKWKRAKWLNLSGVSVDTPKIEGGDVDFLKGLGVSSATTADPAIQARREAEAKQPPSAIAMAKSSEGVGAGMDPRMFKVLGKNLYASGQTGKVIAKELLQNMVDSVRPYGESGGKIQLNYSDSTRTFDAQDNGTGMLPETVAKEFVDVGGSLKPEGASGGFGIAKVVIFSHAENINLRTVAKKGNGQLVETTLTGSGDDWINGKLRIATNAVPKGTPTGTRLQVRLSDEVPVEAYNVSQYLENFKSSHRLGHEFDFNVQSWGSSKKIEPPKAPPMRKMLSVSVTGADADFYVSSDTKSSYSADVEVLNRGIPQFTISKYVSGGKEVKLPSKITVDVKPNVSPEDDNYPFRLDREGLQREIDTKLEDWIKSDLVEAGIRNERAKFKFTLDKARKTKSGYKVIDTQDNVDPKLMDELAEDVSIDKLTKGLVSAFKMLQISLQQFSPEYGTASLDGLGLGTEYLGINISGPSMTGDPTANNTILVNPFVILDVVRELESQGLIKSADLPRVFAKEMTSTLVHELTHQPERNHDERFSGSLTRNVGRTLDSNILAVSKLEGVLRENGEQVLRITEHYRQKLAAREKRADIFAKVGASSTTPAPGRRGAGAPGPSRGASGRSRPPEVVPDSPVGEAKELAPGTGARSRKAERFLTPDEKATVGDDFAPVQKMFDSLPGDFATAAKLGSVGRYWYENSSRALKNYFGDDAPQFTNLLAAYSPRQTVRENLVEALKAWNEWDGAGRPTDEPTVNAILDKYAGGSGMAGRFQSAARTLMGDPSPLSGQKINSFYQNLIGNVEFVTNDVWMAKFAGIAHAVLGTKYGYLGLTAKVRQAARSLGWSPQQVQSGVWVFTKALWELGVKGMPPQEVVTRMHLSNMKDISDFATLFGKDEDVRAKLNEILARRGETLESIESGFTRKDKSKRGAEETVSPKAARSVARRLEPGIAESRQARVEARSAIKEERAKAVGQGSLFGGLAGAAKESLAKKRPGEAGAIFIRPKRAPEQERAHAAIDFRGKNTGNDKPGWVERFITSVTDDLHPLLVAERAMGGGPKRQGKRLINAAASAYIQARRARGAPGVAQGFLEDGVKDHDGNRLSGSYAEAMGLLKKAKVPDNTPPMEAFATYLTAKRVTELHAQGKTSLPISLADAQATTAAYGTIPEFKAAEAKLKQFRSAVLEYAVRRGVLSQAGRDAMENLHKDYVPFERMMDFLSHGADPTGAAKRVANRRSPLRHMKATGSDRRIVNPLETDIKNTFAMVDMAEKNAAMQKLAALADATPNNGWIEKVPVTGFTYKPGSPIVSVIRSGVVNWYKVTDPALYEALTAIGEQTPAALGIAAAMTSLLRRSATLAVGFVARNPLRDTWSASIQSRYGFKLGVDTIRGAFESVGKSKLYYDWLNSGGAQSALVSMDRQLRRSEINKMLYGGSMGASLADLRHGKAGKAMRQFVFGPYDALAALSEAMENATRLGEFRQAMKVENPANMPAPGEEALARAGMASRDVTMDFSRGGDWSRSYNKYSAFFNAFVQGPTRAWEEFRAQKGRTALRAFVAVTLPTIALWLLNRDNPNYQEIDQKERDKFWHIPLDGSGSSRFAKIPKPQEFGGLFANYPQAGFQYWYDHDRRSLEEAIGKYGLGTKEDAWSMVSHVIPTALLPFIEVTTNWSTYRQRHIISPYDEDIDNDLKYTNWTSNFSKVLGKGLDVPPVYIDHIITGYTANLGRSTVESFNPLFGESGQQPRNAGETLPGVGGAYGELRRSFYRDTIDQDATSIRRMYEDFEELAGAKSSLNRRLARNVDEDAPDTEQDAETVEQTRLEMSKHSRVIELRERLGAAKLHADDIRDAIKKVFSDEATTPQEKQAQINYAYKALANLARQLYEKPPIK